MSTAYHNLSTGSLSQNWSDAGLITANDNWDGVPSIQGFRGDNLTASTGTDPRTLLAVDAAPVLDVNANQTNPITFNTGGATEFALADPVVALAGSGTADAPYLVIYLDARGRKDVSLSFNARDLDGSADDAIQQLAVQYRLSATSAWTNLPAGYIADATTPNLATLVTPVSLTLPAAANNAEALELRIITTNAAGNDEWVGIDDIVVSSLPATADSDGVTITESGGSTALAEGGNSDSYSVVLQSQPAFDVTVAIDAGTQTSSSASSLTFTPANWNVPQNVTLTAVDDAAVEGPHVALIGHTTSSADAAYNGLAVASVQASITDNDAPARTTRIADIQGESHRSPLVGQVVQSVPGIVTAVAANGFYLQDPQPDANPKTSEGLFVFTSSVPTVAVGDAVLVSGTVTEFRPGNNANNLTVTEITSPTVSVQSSGNALPAATLLGQGGLALPNQVIYNDAPTNVEAVGSDFDPGSEGIDFWESLEGMRVQLNNAVTTSPTRKFGSSEELWVLADGGAGASSRTERGGSLITASDFNPERIQLDDLNNAGITFPTLNVGTRLNTVTGVVNYDFGNYEVLIPNAPGVAQASALLREVTALTAMPAQLTVATFNVENLDPSDGAARFGALAAAIVNNLRTPDIINLEEVQDNNGATNDNVVDAGTTLQTLIDAIVLAGGPAYEYRQISPVDDTNGGEPGGNIRVAFLFNPDRVDFVDRPGGMATVGATVGNVGGEPVLSASPGLIDPGNAAFNASRKPLVGEFMFNGEKVFVIGNHFNSKGGDQPLFGVNQPPVLASEVQRLQQAAIVEAFVQDLLAVDPAAKVIVAGDLNDFEFSAPLSLLEGGGLTSLIETLPADERYTYNFEGNAQALDHLMASASLVSALDGYDVVHMNSEFADQVSDHDPVVARFNIGGPAFTLQLLHYYGESGLLGTQTAAITGALIDRFDDAYANTLVLGEGDSFIPGPWLVGGADPSLNAVPGIGSTALGRPDIAIMNAFGTDASALGNHEFDLGSPVLQGAIAASGAWVGAQFPFITSNLDFAADAALRGLADRSLNNNFNNNAFAGQEASAIKGKIAPYTVVTQNGERIGIVGATTYDLLIKTSPNGTVPRDDGNPGTNDLEEVAVYVQAAVDALRALGINKIVMLDQLDTIERNLALAPLVSGIDVMVAGGGHERLGDETDVAVAFNGHDANFVDTYPLVATGSDGKTTLIVTTDTEYSYLGRLVLDFDANGEILLGNLDPAVNGAYAANEATLQAAYGSTQTAAEIVAGSSIGSRVDAITDAIAAVVAAKDAAVWGYTRVYLEGDRVFGRAQEVNLGDVTADANLLKARAALPDGAFVVSHKNGGGLRASIGSIDADGNKIPPAASDVKPAGGISTLDIENALRFDNKLMVFDTTPQGLKNILEYAAGLAPGNGGYMQIGGLRVSFDPAQPVGQKVQSIALIDDDGSVLSRVVEQGVVRADAPATISVIALNFTANGGDGYPMKANGENFRYLKADGSLSAAVNEALDFTAEATFATVGLTGSTLMGEQQAFKDYLQAEHATPDTAIDLADTPASLDQRIQNLGARSDTVFEGDELVGGAGRQLLLGTPGDDHFLAGGGRDLLVGGDGDDTFEFVSLLDFYDTITDFRPGSDHLDIQALLRSVGYTGADPVGDAYLSILPINVPLPNAGLVPLATLVMFDADGAGTAELPRPMVVLTGVAMTDANDLLLPAPGV